MPRTLDELSIGELLAFRDTTVRREGATVVIDAGGQEVADALVAALLAEARSPTTAPIAKRLAAIESDLTLVRIAVSDERVTPAAEALDRARTRKLNAEADKLERETAAEYGAPPDDGADPVLCDGWTVQTDEAARVIRLTLRGVNGRSYALALLPAKGPTLAENLLAAARFAEKATGKAGDR